MVSVALRLSWKEVFGELNGSIGVFEFPAISQRISEFPAISQRNVLPAISFHFFFTVHSSRHFALSVSLMTNDDHDGRDKRVALS